jgi:2-dehydro-3-deoxygalactonokinase
MLPMSPAFIALDWGTTSFRAYLVATGGAIVESRTDQAGILSVADGAFEAAFERHVAGWDMQVPVLASGMITSRQGWLEVPYVSCPAGLGELAAGVRRLRCAGGREIVFVPGVSCRPEGAAPDVIRGEETQVLGAAVSDGVAVTRGTHCKWLEIKEGRIQRFATFMTGELYAVLKEHSILGRLMSGTGSETDEEGFARGVRRGLSERDSAGGMLHALFSVRTHGLFGDLRSDQLASYLSGLLLGAEIAGARAMFSPGTRPISIIGVAELAGPFGTALTMAGLNGKAAPADAAVRGLSLIGKRIGVL